VKGLELATINTERDRRERRRMEGLEYRRKERRRCGSD